MANLRSIVASAFDSVMRSHQQHHATPERKQRRALVKKMGRRQAIKWIKAVTAMYKSKPEVNHG